MKTPTVPMIKTMRNNIELLSKKKKGISAKKRKLQEDLNEMEKTLKNANINASDSVLDNLMKKAKALPKALFQGSAMFIRQISFFTISKRRSESLPMLFGASL